MSMENENSFEKNAKGPDQEILKESMDGSNREGNVVPSSVVENPEADEGKPLAGMKSIDLSAEDFNVNNQNKATKQDETCQSTGEADAEEAEPVFDGTEVPGMGACQNVSSQSLDLKSETQESIWPEKALSIKNFVKEKGSVAVSTVLRRLSGKSDDGADSDDASLNKRNNHEDAVISPKEGELKIDSPKTMERLGWNPLNFIKISRDDAADENDSEQKDKIEGSLSAFSMKGRILLYTQLGCQDSKEIRKFMYRRRLPYVEINMDIYPSRKVELEKMAGSSSVPKVFFNKSCVGGLEELNSMDESGELAKMINNLINEEPPVDAPLPPLPGEDDMSSSAGTDEMAVIVQKMRQSIIVKDRFNKMRRFTSCFLGSEAVDFISEDQYLERDEAVEFCRQLASQLFFRHVLGEHLFEDGNHLYRFLDQDPVIASQCRNIPRGLIEAKPKPVVEIATSLRLLCSAMFEAYVSEGGRHVNYRSIQGSEEFARYLRTVEELQRVDMEGMAREEKLAFFINLYNMMAIHAILVFGHPSRAMERRKLFGDFKYVIAGCAYSLSAIHNGILRGNQRPPYNLIKPFGAKDKRAQIALPYGEPLVHFALVCGSRSGPALRCYSAGNIDKELMEAARSFIQGGGLIVDINGKMVSASKILKWYSADFGNNEVEVLKHAANYLTPTESEALLELLATTQLKVIYQPYEWGLNC